MGYKRSIAVEWRRTSPTLFVAQATRADATATTGAAVIALDVEGRRPSAEPLAHVSPLAWEHITLTGEYRRNQPDSPDREP